MVFKNARIDRTMLGYEDHGVLTSWIFVDYGGSGQGFGGYALDRFNPKTKAREGTKFAANYIIGLLQTLGVDTWEKLPGTYCRIYGDYGKAEAIGHLLEDKWFLIREGQVITQDFPLSGGVPV